MSAALVFFSLLGVTHFQYLLFFAFIAAPVIAAFNIRFGYIAGAYGFFFMGVTVITYFAASLGAESYSILYLFPIIITLIQILGRRETIAHMFVLIGVYFTATVVLSIIYHNDLYRLPFDGDFVGRIWILILFAAR
jgi:hypothetical protein